MTVNPTRQTDVRQYHRLMPPPRGPVRSRRCTNALAAAAAAAASWREEFNADANCACRRKLDAQRTTKATPPGGRTTNQRTSGQTSDLGRSRHRLLFTGDHSTRRLRRLIAVTQSGMSKVPLTADRRSVVLELFERETADKSDHRHVDTDKLLASVNGVL